MYGKLYSQDDQCGWLTLGFLTWCIVVSYSGDRYGYEQTIVSPEACFYQAGVTPFSNLETFLSCQCFFLRSPSTAGHPHCFSASPCLPGKLILISAY